MYHPNYIIKVCGMTDGENIRQTEQLGVDFIGFIFYPRSPRFLFERPTYLPVRSQRIGVFVNESKDNILMYADRFGLNYIQLHGNESPEYCHNLQATGMKLIKVFSIATPRDLSSVSAYEGLCQYYLFDTKTPQYGGSGNQFDWTLLNRYTGNTPFLLSGGINQYSAAAIRNFHHPRMAGVDINSRFESSPGLKDIGRIQTFISELRRP